LKIFLILLASLLLIYLVLLYEPLPGNEMKDEYFTQFKLRDTQIPIFYSPIYNMSFLGIEKLHPFDSKKYGRIFHILTRKGIIQEDQVVEPSRPTRDILLKIHTEQYLESLKNARKLAHITEIGLIALMPWRITHKRVLVPMLHATGGTILAAKAALDRGWAINLGGGYHHASSDNGGGFCVFADITLSIKNLQESEPRVQKIMIIDLDAHQGNGYARDFLDHENVFILDMYNRFIYPNDEFAKRGVDLKVELDPYIEDDKYLSLLSKALSLAFKKFSPDIIYYNAGTDLMLGDPLGLMKISPSGIIKRDEMVFKKALTHKVPIVMLLSGGYQRANAPVIAESIKNLLSIINKEGKRKLY